MASQKTILVTGGLGFIGSNFLNVCVPKYKDYFFINIDSLTSAADINNVSIANESNYFFEKVDIRDLNSLERVFKENKITDVIHFAAESNVDVSIENPQIFVETNIIGTHNLLKFALKYKINRFFQISTDEVYGSMSIDDKPFTTKSNLAPNNPYSASKAAGDMLVRAYHKTYGLNAIISRSTNNYGPNQDDSKLIPKFIKLLLKDKKVTLHGNGENIRDWIYVLDHIEALDLIFHKGISGCIYNIGANNEISNKEITKKLLELVGKDESYIEYVKDRPANDLRYAIDTTELFKDFGWKAETSFEEGIQKTLEFYKKKFELGE